MEEAETGLAAQKETPWNDRLGPMGRTRKHGKGGSMYRIAAAVLLLVFYAIYYGKLISQKKSGVQTNQIKNQKRGAERTIGMLMSLATVLVLAAEVAAIALNVTGLPAYARTGGLIVAALGDAVFFVSVATMGSSWRAGVSETEKTQLVTHGIYIVSRNPAFLAFDLVYIGTLLMFFSWWLLLFTVFAVVMFHLQVVRVEEPFLMTAFGAEYRSYHSKVCRYLGRKA